MKTQNKKIIEYVTIQRKMLRKFKDTEDFIENVRLNGSTIYFEIGLYKFLKKFRLLKNSTLSSRYFKNHLKLSRAFITQKLFSQEKNCINGSINHYCF